MIKKYKLITPLPLNQFNALKVVRADDEKMITHNNLEASKNLIFEVENKEMDENKGDVIVQISFSIENVSLFEDTETQSKAIPPQKDTLFIANDENNKNSNNQITKINSNQINEK